ncbi:MAG: cell envelope integrity protein CreD [Ferruginibacter sp.]
MNKNYKAAVLAFNIWWMTALVFTIAALIMQEIPTTNFAFLPWLIITLVLSFPVFLILLIAIQLIRRLCKNFASSLVTLLIVETLSIIPYAVVAGTLGLFFQNYTLPPTLVAFIVLTGSAFFSTYIFSNLLQRYFFLTPHFSYQSSIKHTTMQTESPSKPASNKILFKGLIAGGLVLLMLIPTLIVQNLVAEREARQKEVVQEVSAKWATSQTLAGPFMIIPYTENATNSEGKPVVVKKELIVLSQQMNVTGKIIPVSRPRSIYKVLLYKSDLNINGVFQPKWPSGTDTATLDFTKAKLCIGISDYKGIEEEITVNFNKQPILLSPGLPENSISNTGLSLPVSVSYETLAAGIPYNLKVKLKGSERLHFMPMSANSSFALNSTWPSPSFDGNALPNERNISEKGFDAKWSYNQANLPFGTVIKNNVNISNDISFGVTMVQPADQYNKTMRSIKYAILIIGLTFALFFIIEIMQGKPFHPVQYVLVGLALVIFYTLLLAISEYILFDYAYGLAAAATTALITLYANSHFKNWKTAAIFGSALSLLYSFIFILLCLEDTALLVGSIGLFIVLAIVMYVSRKVNWYGNTPVEVQI